MSMTALTTASISMTSKEIADLVEKRHDNVKRTIELLAEQGVITFPQTEDEEFLDSLGRKQSGKVYRFPVEQKRDTYIVVAQLSPKFTARLVDRWQELEQGAAPSVISFPTPHDKALHLMEVELKVGALFQAPQHFVQAEAVKTALRETGVDFSHYLSVSPAQDNIPPEHEMLEPADLAKRFSIVWSTGTPNGAAINDLLGRHGYQEKPEGVWMPTEAGKPYCQRHHWTKGTKTGYNYKWSVPLVEYLLDLESKI